VWQSTQHSKASNEALGTQTSLHQAQCDFKHDSQLDCLAQSSTINSAEEREVRHLLTTKKTKKKHNKNQNAHFDVQL
jgi:hypothetical protein